MLSFHYHFALFCVRWSAALTLAARPVLFRAPASARARARSPKNIVSPKRCVPQRTRPTTETRTETRSFHPSFRGYMMTASANERRLAACHAMHVREEMLRSEFVRTVDRLCTVVTVGRPSSCPAFWHARPA